LIDVLEGKIDIKREQHIAICGMIAGCRRKLETAQSLPPKKVDRRRQQTPINDPEAPQHQYTRIRARLMQHINTLIETLTGDRVRRWLFSCVRHNDGM